MSAPVTLYYVAGALLTASIGGFYERLGPRAVVASGSVAMAAGVAALGAVTQPWQLYPAFLMMAVGWGSMSGAAINASGDCCRHDHAGARVRTIHALRPTPRSSRRPYPEDAHGRTSCTV